MINKEQIMIGKKDKINIILFIKSFPICRTIDFRQTGLHLSSAVPVDVLV